MPHSQTFKCPQCGHVHGSGPNGPNFTAVPAPGPTNWIMCVLSCRNCGVALGATSAPSS